MDWLAVPGTLGLIVEFLVKTTAVLSLALFAAAAAGRRSAAFRHVLLASALIGLLLLPLLSLVPGGWNAGFLPGRPDAAKAASSSPMTPARAAAIEPIAAAEFARTGAPLESGGSKSLPQAIDTFVPRATAVTVSEKRAGLALSPAVPFRNPSVRGEADSGNDLDIVLVVLWSAGLLILGLRLAVGLAAAIKLSAEGRPLTGVLWNVLVERFLTLLPLRRRVRLKSHPRIAVPMTWGWRRPVVLLPAGADGWTDEDRRSALYHELSHVKRADFLVMLAVRAGLAAFWWNPLAWIVYRRLRKEQEIACDELVLRAGIKPSAYAASLLAFRRSAGPGGTPSAALLGLLGRAAFPERLEAILGQKPTHKEVKMKTRIMLAGAVVLAVAVIGTARPAAGLEPQDRDAVAALAETAVAAPSSPDVILPPPAAPEQAVVQEKEKKKEGEEKAKAAAEKAAAEVKIAVEAKAKGAPIVLTITQGGEVKTLKLDKPLTITTKKDGGDVVLTVDGKEIQVLKGEPLQLEIKGGQLRILKEGVPVKIGESGAFKIVEDFKPGVAWTLKADGKDGHTVYYVTRDGKAVAEVKGSNIKEGELKTAWVIQPKREGDEIVIYGTPYGIPVDKLKKGDIPKGGYIIRDRKPGDSGSYSEVPDHYYSAVGNKDMLEKVKSLQEQVQAVKAKKLDISALEESLKKLEEELKAGEAKAKGLTIGISDSGKAGTYVGTTAGENTIQIIFTSTNATAADFDRITAKLKKDLPEGYKVEEQKFEDGAMRFTIKRPEGAKADEELVRKLVESVRSELKDKK